MAWSLCPIAGRVPGFVMKIEMPHKTSQNFAREEFLSLIGIILTIISYIVIFYDQSMMLTGQFLARNLGKTSSILFYTLIITMFSYAIFVYHISRLYYYFDLRANLPRQEKAAAASADEIAPGVTILIPSYSEQVSVIWQTMMSAALLDYPDRRIVLLLDNPQDPATAADKRLLLQSRQQTEAIKALFQPIAQHFAATTQALRISSREQAEDRDFAFLGAAELYEQAADFLESIAADVRSGALGDPDTHVRRFFIDTILMAAAGAHRQRRDELMAAPRDLACLDAELRRLSTMFAFDISMFERKAFVNLTHAPNKASNLNAYLGLMGGSFKTEWRSGRQWLLRAGSDDEVSFAPRDSQFIVILDADSFMHPDYIKKTMAVMLAPGNERIAVAQTPYKAIPGSPSLLERTAGASTDVHFCVAEGMSGLRAGFWVGATALVRVSALCEIAELGEERGFHFPVFVPDKTPIEDADATIRLVTHGWRIHHLPEHLNWSSTPGDFGSLVIQRRRWANGGLVILPDLIKHWRSACWSRPNLMEAFLRTYHLLAAPVTSVAGLAILIYPFDTSYASMWVSLALVPYLYLHGRDLKRLGYGWIDLFRIFALNLILLPVILAGVVKSVEQLIYGRKIPFARTPKIQHRTTVPALYLLAALALTGWSMYSFFHAVMLDQRGQAFPSFFCSVALTYAVLEFVGLWPLTVDIWRSIQRPFASAIGPLWQRLRGPGSVSGNVFEGAE